MNDAGVLPGSAASPSTTAGAPYRNFEDALHALCGAHPLRELTAAEEQGQAWALGTSCLPLDATDAVEQAKIAAGKRLSTKAQNLLLRPDQREPEVLRFASDFRVPFHNNLSERDLRMIKLQQKISGCWRTTQGAERFRAIRSYLSTARKQGQRLIDVLRQLTAGEPWLPTAPSAERVSVRTRRDPSRREQTLASTPASLRPARGRARSPAPGGEHARA